MNLQTFFNSAFYKENVPQTFERAKKDNSYSPQDWMAVKGAIIAYEVLCEDKEQRERWEVSSSYTERNLKTLPTHLFAVLFSAARQHTSILSVRPDIAARGYNAIMNTWCSWRCDGLRRPGYRTPKRWRI